MNDEQIVLNLEEMAGFKSLNLGCRNVLHNAIALINRQKAEMEKALATIDGLINGQETLQKYIAEKDAEIERLKNENFCLGNERDALLGVMDTAVSEAVKEFAKFLLDNKIDVVDLTAEYLKECPGMDE